MKKLQGFSHVEGRRPGMVDISHKLPTARMACAQSIITLPAALLSLMQNEELHLPKGPVMSTAIIAGTMAAKNTWQLLPFCHPLLLSSIQITVRTLPPGKLKVTCTVKTTSSTGVEMEALTGASIAALTIYDMCKSAAPGMIIGETRLMQKSGGRHDFDARQN